MSKDAVKRIVNKDMKQIEKMNLSELGIHVNFNEENILKATAIIIGPEGTPYENGILYFIIEFPNNYPFSPPKVGYLSHSRHRVHPNLYVGRSHDNHIGKVCISAINTWSGPKWTTVMDIGSVLLSIQSLLNNNPLHNEPGFENEKGERNDTYNQMVEYDTYNHLIKNNGFKLHPLFIPFEDVISKHLKNQKDNILKNLEILCKKYPKTIKASINVYNLMMIMDYKNLENEIAGKYKCI
jgi:ubiquitin-conjugating enzyme E2 Z